MGFAERLREARTAAALTQKELSTRVGVTERTIQNYETGCRIPRRFEAVEAIASALGAPLDSLLDQRDMLLIDAREKGGKKSADEVDRLISEVSGLFAGGDIDESEKDGIMAALNRAYWMAKEKNRKYAPSKYRGNRSDSDGGNHPGGGGDSGDR